MIDQAQRNYSGGVDFASDLPGNTTDDDLDEIVLGITERLKLAKSEEGDLRAALVDLRSGNAAQEARDIRRAAEAAEEAKKPRKSFFGRVRDAVFENPKS